MFNPNYIRVSKLNLALASLTILVSVNTQAIPIKYIPSSPISAPLTQIADRFQSTGPYTGITTPFNVDINFDGVNDLFLFNERYEYSSRTDYPSGSYSLYSERSNISNITSTGTVDGSSRYFSGNLIGSDSSTFINSGLFWEYSYTDDYCDIDGECWYDQSAWGGGAYYSPNPGRTSYVGFSFLINGAEHFGWADAIISNDTMTLNSWGWETEDNVGIIAGAGALVPIPPSLGLFVFGFISLFGFSKVSRIFTRFSLDAPI